MKEKMETEYLGTMITANWKTDTEINNRVQKTKHVYSPKNKNIRKKGSQKLH
jgi:hypothetical protein